MVEFSSNSAIVSPIRRIALLTPQSTEKMSLAAC